MTKNNIGNISIGDDILSIYYLNNTILTEAILRNNRDKEVTCLCDNVYMYISEDNGRFRLEHHIGETHKHLYECPLSFSYRCKSIYDKLWKEDVIKNNDVLIANLDNNYFSNTDYKPIDREYLDNEHILSINNQITFKGLLVRLNLEVWRHFIVNNFKHPENTNDIFVYNKYPDIIKKFIPDIKSLNTLWDYSLHINKSFDSLKFIYGKLIEIKDINEYYSSVTVFDSMLQENITVTIHKNELMRALKLSNIESLDIKNNDFVVGATIINKKISTLGLLPISPYGLYYSSKEELELYSKLTNHKFIKEISVIPEYNNKKPNVTILDDIYEGVIKVIDLKNNIEEEVFLKNLSNINKHDIIEVLNKKG